MKRRLISILLCAALLMTVLPCIEVSASYDCINYKRVVADMVNYFKGKEGDYGSVNRADSNGSCSIGILQWNGVRAKSLLVRVIGLNPADAKDILGSALSAEILNTSVSWKGRSLSVDEGARVSKVLDTSYGHKAQDDQAFEDISGYADHGYRLGIRTDPALEYFCDIENQYGSGGCESVVRKAKDYLGVSTITSLDQFHQALKGYGHPYMTRRNATYNYIKNTLGYDTTGKLVTLPGLDEPPVIDPADVCIGCPGEMFTDMPGKTNWAHTGIEYVLVAGLFCGTSATTFSPDMSMSRAMLVQVLYNVDCGSTGWQTGDAPEGTFTDVAKGSWYEKVVLWAAGRGIVSGVGNGLFCPNADVTREQIATILYRYSELKGYDVSKSEAFTKFADADKVSDYAEKALHWAVAEGLISGETNKGVCNLNPQGAATRAQVACIMMRYVTEYLGAK